MVIVLDGGMGSELARRGDSAANELWSAQALLDAPEAVSSVHDEYIAAGAEIIITNTYSTIPSYLGKSGLADRYLNLAELAGKLARDCADRAATDNRNVRVAGSLPPLDESYRADLVPADSVARPIYRALAKTLANAIIEQTTKRVGQISDPLPGCGWIGVIRKVGSEVRNEGFDDLHARGSGQSE